MMSLSLKKNKQSGFTLIELMVVMAIIAILATAGLSAYTGYIKKARDAKRIADINAINNIVTSLIGVNGVPPQNAQLVYIAVLAANNGKPIIDPLSSNNGATTKFSCMDSSGIISGLVECSYSYRLCDSGIGYAIGTRFESKANLGFYTNRSIPSPLYSDRGMGLEIGSCQSSCPASTPSTCPCGVWGNHGCYYMPTKIVDNSDWPISTSF